MGTIYVFFANGFEEIEAFTAVDVLRRAGLEVEMVTVTDDEVVAGAHDISMICDLYFRYPGYADAELILLPGGMPGADTLSKHKGLNQLIRDFMEEGKPVAAICAAPIVLGRQGLLKGRRVTCYPGYEQELEGAVCTGEQVVKDGNLITGKGPGAAMDFSLAIVDMLLGKEKVAELKDAMCIKS